MSTPYQIGASDLAMIFSLVATLGAADNPTLGKMEAVSLAARAGVLW